MNKLQLISFFNQAVSYYSRTILVVYFWVLMLEDFGDRIVRGFCNGNSLRCIKYLTTIKRLPSTPVPRNALSSSHFVIE